MSTRQSGSRTRLLTARGKAPNLKLSPLNQPRNRDNPVTVGPYHRGENRFPKISKPQLPSPTQLHEQSGSLNSAPASNGPKHIAWPQKPEIQTDKSVFAPQICPSFTVR